MSGDSGCHRSKLKSTGELRIAVSSSFTEIRLTGKLFSETKVNHKEDECYLRRQNVADLERAT